MNKKREPRFPPKNILVPLDDSAASIAAWKQAQSLAKSLGARVQGLYARGWTYHSPADLAFGKRDWRDTVDALRARLGADADLRRVDGPIEETILSWGKHLKFDLIVMGTHGRTGLERALKGSVAEHIVRHASVPVLVTRLPARRFGSILAPVNLEPYSMEGLLYAAKTAAALKARLTVLHVHGSPLYGSADPVKASKKLLADFIARLPPRLREACRPKEVLVFGRPDDEIVAAAGRADLVVLAARRRGYLRDSILGTTAERVLRHCHKPVLAVPVDPVKRRGYALD
ncbi:MAG: universal stress protein [Elusimicrobiota bacterium]|nr:universal stress protein [Elusimicrobiota bacterium]